MSVTSRIIYRIAEQFTFLFHRKGKNKGLLPALNAKVTASDKVVAGSISNTTEMSFREVYLCNQNYAVCIGKMEPGEEMPVNSPSNIPFLIFPCNTLHTIFKFDFLAGLHFANAHRIVLIAQM